MKLISISAKKAIGEIVTNHSMTVDEAIECLGGEIINDATDDRFSDDGDNVIIDGVRYWWEDLDLV